MEIINTFVSKFSKIIRLYLNLLHRYVKIKSNMVIDELVFNPIGKVKLLDNQQLSDTMEIECNAVLMKYLKKQLLLRKNFGPAYLM